MSNGRDLLPFLLGLPGLAIIGYAIKLTLEEARGLLFFGFLIVQAVILIYLLYIVVQNARSAWVDYRWSPDRLR